MRAVILNLLIPLGLTLAVIAGIAVKRATTLPSRDADPHEICGAPDCPSINGAVCASEAPSVVSLLPKNVAVDGSEQ